MARLIGARPEEIIFTSSGAEANNLAIKGVALANLKKGRHLVVSAMEHHSVLNAARFLEKFFDFEVTFLPVDSFRGGERGTSAKGHPPGHGFGVGAARQQRDRHDPGDLLTGGGLPGSASIFIPTPWPAWARFPRRSKVGG